MNENIPHILHSSKTIAVVGLSNNPSRDSYDIASYMQQFGYTIIPVNPAIAEWNGIQSYPDLYSVPVKIDIVNVFRRSEFVPEIVDQAIAVHASVIWLQLGVIHEEAAERAEKAGLQMVMDRCIMVEHRISSR